MRIKNLTIPVDPESAEALTAASPDDQKKIQVLLGLWLRDLTKAEPSDLKKLLDELSRKAKAQGLTSEILDSLLKGA
jgi:hypothetical protein